MMVLQALSNPVLSAVGERYYKVTAEALRVCGELVRVVRPNIEVRKVVGSGWLCKVGLVYLESAGKLNSYVLDCFSLICRKICFIKKGSWKLVFKASSHQRKNRKKFNCLSKWTTIECLGLRRVLVQVCSFDFKPYVHPIYNAILSRLTNQDQDQVSAFSWSAFSLGRTAFSDWFPFSGSQGVRNILYGTCDINVWG